MQRPKTALCSAEEEEEVTGRQVPLVQELAPGNVTLSQEARGGGICMCVCIYVSVYMYIHVYVFRVYTYIYIYTYMTYIVSKSDCDS